MVNKSDSMTNTMRWYHHLNTQYNPYWFMHELKKVRIELHRKYRHGNRIIVKKCMTIKKYIDIEIEPKTRGWITY